MFKKLMKVGLAIGKKALGHVDEKAIATAVASAVEKKVSEKRHFKIDAIGAKHVATTAGVSLTGGGLGYFLFGILIENGLVSPDLGPQTTAAVVLLLAWLGNVGVHLGVKLVRRYPALQMTMPTELNSSVETQGQ